MRNKMIMAGALLGALAIPTFAVAQSNVPAGAAAGAVGGAIVGGPVGAVVGGVAGAFAGGISDASRPQFREYVGTQRRPSHRYQGDVRVGVELPSSGVTYYEAPAEYGVRNYRYTRVNDRIVLVDPADRSGDRVSHSEVSPAAQVVPRAQIVADFNQWNRKFCRAL